MPRWPDCKKECLIVNEGNFEYCDWCLVNPYHNENAYKELFVSSKQIKNYGQDSKKRSNAKKNAATFERTVAKKLGGYRQKMSGGAADIYGNMSLKGDVVTDDYMIECKTRANSSSRGVYINIERQWLEEIEQHAISYNKIPLVVFKFKGYKGEYVIMNEKYDGAGTSCPELLKFGNKQGRVYKDILEDALKRYDYVIATFKDDRYRYRIFGLNRLIANNNGGLLNGAK